MNMLTLKLHPSFFDIYLNVRLRFFETSCSNSAIFVIANCKLSYVADYLFKYVR